MPQNAASALDLHCFATHPAILHIFPGSKMDLLKSIRKSVPNLSKIAHENGILSQKEGLTEPQKLPLNPNLLQNKVANNKALDQRSIQINILLIFP